MTVEIITGDCVERMAGLAAGSVQCCVTSPPYWGLRKYAGEQEVEWSDGTRHPLGREPVPDLYVAHIAEVFRGVWRVLRDDGTLWLNLGDTYNAGRSGGWPGGLKGISKPENAPGQSGVDAPGLKPKDLLGMPWRVAFALQADGWYLRSAIIWAKGLSFCDAYAGSVMPESCRDRPTSSYEMVFLLTKKARYFYDWFAAREAGTYPAGTRAAKGSAERKAEGGVNARPAEYAEYSGTRNWRNTWVINPQAYARAHFATYPEALVEKCITAGTSPYACRECGAPWVQVIDQEPIPDAVRAQFEAARVSTAADHGRGDGFTTRKPNFKRRQEAVGWQTTCGHAIGRPARCVVLDPFGGSGTTGLVARKLGRDAVLIELSDEYSEMARERCNVTVTAPLFS